MGLMPVKSAEVLLRYTGPDTRASFRQNLAPKEGRFAVKRKRFNVEQIVAVLKQAEAGVPLAELIRRVGVSEQTCPPSTQRRPLSEIP